MFLELFMKLVKLYFKLLKEIVEFMFGVKLVKLAMGLMSQLVRLIKYMLISGHVVALIVYLFYPSHVQKSLLFHKNDANNYYSHYLEPIAINQLCYEWRQFKTSLLEQESLLNIIQEKIRNEQSQLQLTIENKRNSLPNRNSKKYKPTTEKQEHYYEYHDSIDNNSQDEYNQDAKQQENQTSSQQDSNIVVYPNEDENDAKTNDSRNNKNTHNEIQRNYDVEQNTQSQLVTFNINEDDRNTLDNSRNTLENSRNTLDNSSNTLDTSMNTLNTSRNTLDTSRNTQDTSINTLDTSRNTLDTSRDTLDNSRSTLDTSRDTLDNSRSTLDSSRTNLINMDKNRVMSQRRNEEQERNERKLKIEAKEEFRERVQEHHSKLQIYEEEKVLLQKKLESMEEQRRKEMAWQSWMEMNSMCNLSESGDNQEKSKIYGSTHSITLEFDVLDLNGWGSSSPLRLIPLNIVLVDKLNRKTMLRKDLLVRDNHEKDHLIKRMAKQIFQKLLDYIGIDIKTDMHTVRTEIQGHGKNTAASPASEISGVIILLENRTNNYIVQQASLEIIPNFLGIRFLLFHHPIIASFILFFVILIYIYLFSACLSCFSTSKET